MTANVLYCVKCREVFSHELIAGRQSTFLFQITCKQFFTIQFFWFVLFSIAAAASNSPIYHLMKVSHLITYFCLVSKVWFLFHMHLKLRKCVKSVKTGARDCVYRATNLFFAIALGKEVETIGREAWKPHNTSNEFIDLLRIVHNHFCFSLNIFIE